MFLSFHENLDSKNSIVILVSWLCRRFISFLPELASELKIAYVKITWFFKSIFKKILSNQLNATEQQ